MSTNTKRALGTKISLFFEGKASLALLQLSLLVSLLLLGLILKSIYEVYRGQSNQGKRIEILAERTSSKVELPTIDLSGARLEPAEDIIATYVPTTPFKVKEAAITLIKRGHVASGIEILKKTPETRKLGLYLEKRSK